MPARYAALPNPHNEPDNVEDEMEAAFEGSDDEEAPFVDAHDRRSISSDDDERHPLRSGSSVNTQSYHPLSQVHSRAASQADGTAAPGVYDFENLDYDYPPPGSPPRRDRALVNNDWGNSNGLIPTNPVSPTYRARLNGSRGGWLGRGARTLLPKRVADRIVGSSSSQGSRVGSGLGNDGVFTNVTAKPAAARSVEDGK
jgi:hypothetical protein